MKISSTIQKTLLLGNLALLGAAHAQSQTASPQIVSSQDELLNPLFSDDAVLQRDRVIPIWGQAAPGAAVTVKLDSQNRSARADATGKWMAQVGPFPASATAHTLSVSSGAQSAVRRNILFGDVWLCGGQSNMEFGVGNLSDAQSVIGAANYPQIRLFTVPKIAALAPQKTVDAQWLLCNPTNIAQGNWNGFSAVAYFFGRKLNQDLGVPIGLLSSSWGGTQAESWVSAGALGTLPDFRPNIAAVQQGARDQNVPYETRYENWLRQADPTYSANWATTSVNWPSVRVPGTWEGSGVAALADVDGVVLFRREIEVPADWAGHDVTLQLGAIDDADVTYWNGASVGNTDGWNTNRQYKIAAAQVKAGRNVIAVRVTDTGGNGGFGSGADAVRLVRDDGQFLPLAGDWQFHVSLSPEQLKKAPPRAEPGVVTTLYNGMIAPLEPFALKGAIWYQGESNAERAPQYERLLPALIGDWRQDFGSPLPFYIVQLAGFMAPDDAPRNDDWPQLRAAQAKTAQNLPDVGLVVTTDIGDQNDIHPKNKLDVGERLARVALAKTYGKNVEFSGPTLQNVKSDGKNLRLTFAHADGGLKFSGDSNRVFAVAGADRNWFWATPRIEGNQVILTSPMVTKPVAARFGWSNLPRASLLNGANLPAAPFDTLR